MRKNIAIVVPVYNEALCVPVLVSAIKENMDQTGHNYYITFVDDGSSASTLDTIKEQAAAFPFVKYISFSRNFGHQNALKAGLDMCDADAIIAMDGDMQHPPALLPQFIHLWEAGNDIVYTIRKDANEISYLKKKQSDFFYKILNNLSGIELERGTADFRLIDRKVANVLRGLKEQDFFWRGLVKWVGFRQTAITYEPGKRVAGKSKYTFKKMMELALKGITSFSTMPLTVAIYIGFISALIAVLYVPYVFFNLYFEHPVSGWASVIMTIAFFGGLQLVILGIIGIYLGKLFMQNKQRPHYIVKETNL